MIKVDAMGDACPIPVVKTRNAIKTLTNGGSVQVFVDNEIAVQNLLKMAEQKKYKSSFEKIDENKFSVILTVGDVAEETSEEMTFVACTPSVKNTVVAVSSEFMGDGNNELGAVLIRSFIFALTEQDELPSTVLFYNGGAKLTCEGSPVLEDIKTLAQKGVEIMTCGTCLDFYGLKDKLQIGTVTNMYSIVEKLTTASLVIKP